MKSIITGINGTVAPVLAKSLRAAEHTVVSWNRTQVPTDNQQAINEFIANEQPDYFFHLANGSPDWAETVAQACAQRGIKFLFTSSVSVFASTQHGPFTVNNSPQPDEDYGNYKFECESRVRDAHPEARVVRLGWQIGETPGGNHMVDFLERTFQREGHITASVNWYQACSFLTDTANGLRQIMDHHPAGLYHLDGNPGLNFYEIALGLNGLLGHPWAIVSSNAPNLNNLLRDERVQVNPITSRFAVSFDGQ